MSERPNEFEIVRTVEELYVRVDEGWFALYSLFLYAEHEEENDEWV